MRYLKWLSMLTILAMLFAMLPATVAEDGVAVEAGEIVDGEPEIEVEGVEGLDALDDPALVLEDADLELDGLEEELQTYETEGQTEAAAVANASGDFEIDEEGTLTRYRGFDKNVVIPDGVKAIGEQAFENDTTMESVSIPNSVTYIGYDAFSGCTGLKSITIPDSVTETGGSVLYRCSGLTSVQLSNKLTTLSSNFFSYCDSLERIALPYGLKSIGYWAFSSCEKLKDISIPASVTEIGGNAFINCDNLESVTLPSGVISIGESAFGSCVNLQSITIPASVTTIDRAAFNGSDNVVIRGTAGTYAERYANGVGIPFNAPVVTIDEKTSWIYDDSDSYDALILYVNQSHTLSAIQKPADLARTLKWSSSNSNVVTVDQSGNIKGISQGTATITANTADGKGKAAQIKVVVPEPTTIECRYDNSRGDDIFTLDDRETNSLTAYLDVPYQYETNVEMPPTWSSSDSSIISIENPKKDSDRDYSVTLKGHKPGKATITVTTPDGGKASIALKVVRPELEDITLNRSKAILGVKEKLTLTAKFYPNGASSTLTWKSNKPTVAAVSKKGVVVAKKVGTAVITVKAKNGKTAKATITVRAAPKSVTLNKSGTVTLKRGKTLKLKATLPKKTASALTWKSSRPKVASVDQKGVVRALKKGTAVITVRTFNGKTAKVTIKVK